jgi:hypothetical protein
MKRKKLQLKEGDLVLIKYDKTDLSMGYFDVNPFGIFMFVASYMGPTRTSVIKVRSSKIGVCHFYTSQIVTILKDKENEKKKATA